MRERARRVVAVGIAAAPAALVAPGGAVVVSTVAACGVGALAWLRGRGASLSAATSGAAMLAFAAPRVAGAGDDGVLAGLAVTVWLLAVTARSARGIAPAALLVGAGAWLADLAVVGAGVAWVAITAPSLRARRDLLVGIVLGSGLGAPRLLPALRAALDGGIGDALPPLAGGPSAATLFAIGLDPIGLPLAIAVWALAAIVWIPTVRPPRPADAIGLASALAVALALDARATVGVAAFGAAIAADRLDAMRRARGDGGRPPGLASRLAAAIAIGAIVAAGGVVATGVHADPAATFRTLAHDPGARDAWRAIAFGACAGAGLASAIALFLRGRLRAPWVAAAALALVAVDATRTPAHAAPRLRPVASREAHDPAHRRFGSWCAGAAAVAVASLAFGARRR